VIKHLDDYCQNEESTCYFSHDSRALISSLRCLWMNITLDCLHIVVCGTSNLSFVLIESKTS